MNECGGVLVPDGDDWRRTCFVEERCLASTLAGVIYRNGARPLKMSSDHYLPKSVWPEDGRLHDVHYYCQLVQGGLITVTVLTPDQRSQFSRAGLAAQTHEQRSRIGHARATHTNHIRWHVRREIISSECELCA